MALATAGMNRCGGLINRGSAAEGSSFPARHPALLERCCQLGTPGTDKPRPACCHMHEDDDQPVDEISHRAPPRVGSAVHRYGGRPPHVARRAQADRRETRGARTRWWTWPSSGDVTRCSASVGHQVVSARPVVLPHCHIECIAWSTPRPSHNICSIYLHAGWQEKCGFPQPRWSIFLPICHGAHCYFCQAKCSYGGHMI
jgi:hypothetical protein